MCIGSFRLYWAAMLEYWDASSFDWTKDPYLSSALPVIQVNGWCVVVYYARLKQGSDPSFESSSKCCFLVWLRVSHRCVRAACSPVCNMTRVVGFTLHSLDDVLKLNRVMCNITEYVHSMAIKLEATLPAGEVMYAMRNALRVMTQVSLSSSESDSSHTNTSSSADTRNQGRQCGSSGQHVSGDMEQGQLNGMSTMRVINVWFPSKLDDSAPGRPGWAMATCCRGGTHIMLVPTCRHLTVCTRRLSMGAVSS